MEDWLKQVKEDWNKTSDSEWYKSLRTDILLFYLIILISKLIKRGEDV